MLKIGEFSKATGLTVKALRHYERLGLVSPYWIDKYTSYRYYEESQVDQVRRVLDLKAMGFSLKQVRSLLKDNLSTDQQRQVFKGKRQELLRQLASDQKRLDRLDLHLQAMETAPQLTSINKEIEMELELKKIAPFKVVGLLYQGKNEHQEISSLWNEFNRRGNELCPAATKEVYGVCRMIPGITDGSFEYVAGVSREDLSHLPTGTVIREVPACTVAVFRHIGAAATLHDTYQKIYSEWLPSSSFQPLEPGFDMEVYNEEFTFFAPGSVMYIYVPVKPKA